MDTVTLATEEKWVALVEQQKNVVNAIQAELRTLQLKTDTLQTSITQQRNPPPRSEIALVIEERRLCVIPSAALIKDSSNPTMHLPIGSGIQLNLT